MPRKSRRQLNTTVAPLTTTRFMIPRLSDPDEIVAVEIEDAGYDDANDCYVTRFRFTGQQFRNEFDPKDVPFGALREARDITNAALLERFDLDYRKAERAQ